jgi:N-acetylneuraminic acid mutarotase
MKKQYFLFPSLACLLGLAVSLSAPAQTVPSDWTWMGGSNTIGNTSGRPGVYGTLGVPAASNVPGGRYAASSWTDPSGNFWLFGGAGSDVNGNYGRLNDLWEFDPTTGQWAWVSGSNIVNQPGVIGPQFVLAGTNSPGSREDAASWTDSSGHLWLFGGVGYNSTASQILLNDLWKFSPASGEWAWMGGSTSIACGEFCGVPGVYGTLGTPSAGNVPGSRANATTWTDSSGNLWLFGGDGYDANGNQGALNDLWEFSPSSGQWTWISGADTINQSGIYCEVCALTNFPGSRWGASGWTDSSGHLWLFGGWGKDSAGNWGDLNDLWEFNPSNGQWVWMGGSGTTIFENAAGEYSQPGVYGTLGTPAASNIPGGRDSAVNWTDGSGNLWLFGGQGVDSVGAGGPLNDLWEYSPSLGEWTWMGGSSKIVCVVLYQGQYDPLMAVLCGTPGVYGTLGLPAPGNLPGSRFSAVNWTGSNGQFWLFGGGGLDSTESEGDLNDLWVYQPIQAAATPAFSVASGSYAPPQTVTISDATAGATIYYTTNGSTPTTSSAVYSAPLTVSSTETLEALAAASGFANSAVASATYTMVSPSFSIAGSAVSVMPGATTGNTSTITLTPSGGFTGSVALTAAITSSPANAVALPSLSFGSTSPVSIATSAGGTATLTISTTLGGTLPCTAAQSQGPSLPWAVGGGAVLACVLLFGIPMQSRRWRNLLGLLLLLAALAGGVTSCGGVATKGYVCPTAVVAGTTPGSYTITVTGTSGAITSTGTVTLNVVNAVSVAQ